MCWGVCEIFDNQTLDFSQFKGWKSKVDIPILAYELSVQAITVYHECDTICMCNSIGKNIAIFYAIEHTLWCMLDYVFFIER